MKTFFALTVIPKSQQTGDGGSRFHKKSTDVEKDDKQPKMLKPLYETAADVTKAIATGTKQTDPNYPMEDPYRLAERWQKELKRLAPKIFKPTAKKANRNGKINFTMNFR